MGGSTVGRTVANDRVRQETRSSDNYRESLTTNACTHLPTHIFWVTHDYAVNYPLPSSCQKKVIIVIIIMSSKMKVASQHWTDWTDCDTVPNKTKDIFTL